MYKQGPPLLAAQARDIAASGGVAWCVLVDFDTPDKSYNGPVTFSPANVGYYVEELKDEIVVDTVEEAASHMLSLAMDDDVDVKITLTDFDPDEFESRNIVFEDFGEGTFCLYQAVECE